MSLFTRSILLLSIFVLAVTLSTGIAKLGDSSASATDRFVAARNLNRAIAYQTIQVQGGRVAKTGHGNHEDTQDIPLEDGAKSYVAKADSLIADAAILTHLDRKKLAAEAAKYDTGWDGKPGIAELSNQISAGNRAARDRVMEITRFGDELRQVAVQLNSYRNVIQSAMQGIFNMDYEVHRALVDLNALRAERLQLTADEGRTRDAIRALEEDNWKISKDYERVATIIGMYEKSDPTIRAKANTTGKPWLRGVVTRASEDRYSGLVWVNLGQEDGIQEGQRFAIYRGGSFVAYVRIQSVNPGESLARMEEAFRGVERVLPNDTVRVATNFGGGRQ